jgi:hypothetical protein
MSGTISFGPNRHWIIQAWIWNSVRRSIASYLQTSDPDLANRFTSVDADALKTVELIDIGPEQFAQLGMAARLAFENYVHDGPERFTDIDGYVDLLRRFSELKCLMNCDPRMNFADTQIGSVLLPFKEWIAPGWIFDAVVEQIGAKSAFESLDLSTQFLSARLNKDSKPADLRNSSKDEIAILRRAAKYFAIVYTKHTSQAFTDPETFNRVKPYFTSFDQFLSEPSS